MEIMERVRMVVPHGKNVYDDGNRPAAEELEELKEKLQRELDELL